MKRAARLRRARVEAGEEKKYFGQLGVGSSFQLAIAGLSNDVSYVRTTDGQLCSVVNTCGKIGPGIFGGTGAVVSVGEFEGTLQINQESSGHGFFLEGSALPGLFGGGVNFLFSNDGFSGGTGRGGAAAGAAFGYQYCVSRVTGCE